MYQHLMIEKKIYCNKRRTVCISLSEILVLFLNEISPPATKEIAELCTSLNMDIVLVLNIITVIAYYEIPSFELF